MAGEIDKEPQAPAPYPLAMVVCDGVWQDPYTKKFTLIGTFSALGGRRFPLIHPIISVFVSLTDGRGKVPCRLQLVDVDEVREPVFELSQELEFADPRVIFEVVFQATGIRFPAPGEYRLKLFARDEFIIERRIIVADLSKSRENPKP
ncbi:MAG: hypothetical protein HYS13_18705 [Planctomycetia bacterium]|nr:hypothetical protein [Planctomycetia bacterium]